MKFFAEGENIQNVNQKKGMFFKKIIISQIIIMKNRAKVTALFLPLF